MRTTLQTKLVAIISGLSLGIGMMVFTLWPLSLVSFFGVLYIAKQTATKPVFVDVFIVGILAYGLSFFTLFWSTLPLDWLGLGGFIGTAIIASIWSLTVAVFALSFAGCIYVVSRQRLRPFWFAAVVALAYVVADTLGTLLFSLVFAGPAATIGTHFTMGSPAYQLADSTLLIQLSSVFGLYGLLFVQALFGGVLYVWCTQYRGWTRGLGVGVWLVGFAMVVGNFVVVSEPDRSAEYLSVGVVTTYRSNPTIVHREQLIESLSAMPSTVDIIALPEDSRFIQNLTEPEKNWLANTFTDTVIADSGTKTSAAGLLPEIQLYDTTNRQYEVSTKEFLMVFGEYMPWLYQAIGYGIGYGETVRMLQSERGYITQPAQLFTVQNILVSARLCSEAMSPIFYTQDTRNGAGVLFNLASHGWFHQSKILHDLSIRVASVRAVENGRWYVRAGNESPSYVINSRGQIIVAHDWFTAAPIVVSVPVLTHATYYTRLQPYLMPGLWLVFILIVFTLNNGTLTGRRFFTQLREEK